MNSVAVILAALARADILVNLEGEQLHAVSEHGPLSREARRLIGENRAALIAFLTWRPQAERLMAECLRRIDAVYEPGARLDAARFAAMEQRLDEAFWAVDREHFVAALRDWRLAAWRACARQSQRSRAGDALPQVTPDQNADGGGGG